MLQQNRGTATAKVMGDAGALKQSNKPAKESTLRCRWWTYETAGPKTVVVEQWGGVYRVLAGETIEPSDLELIPGS